MWRIVLLIALIPWLAFAQNPRTDGGVDDALNLEIHSSSPTLWLDPDSETQLEPIVHYTCEDNAASTVVTDKSGNYAGTAAQNTNAFTAATGKILRALDFDGADSKIDTGADVIGAGEDSACAWVYVDGAHEGAAGIIAYNAKFFWYLNNGTPATISLSCNGAANLTTSGIVAAGAWTHLCVTRTSAGVGQHYVNGVPFGASGTCGAPAGGTTNLFIGGNSASTQSFNGKLDDIRIYNRALTPSEISAIYNSGTGHQNQATNNSRGAIVVDASGNIGAWQSRVGGIEFVQATDTAKPNLADPAGRENLFTYAEQINVTTGGWQLVRTSVAPDSIAGPFGDTTADTLIDTNTTNSFYYYQTPVMEVADHTNAVYVKRKDYNWVWSGLLSGGVTWRRCWYNLTPGAEALGNCINGATGKMTSVGNGWFRVETTGAQGTAQADVASIGMSDANSDINGVGTGARGTYFWGSQFYKTARAASSDYVKTTTNAVRPGLNGRRVLAFDGGDYLATSSLLSSIITTKLSTIMLVGRKLATGTLTLFEGFDGTIRLYATDSAFSASTYDTGARAATQNATMTNPFIATSRRYGTMLDAAVNSNYSTKDVEQYGTIALTLGANLGARYDNTTPWAGLLGPIVAHNKVLPEFTLDSIGRGLSQRYAIGLAGATAEIPCDQFISSLTPTLWLDSSDTSTISKDGANKVAGWWSKDANNGRENLLQYSEQLANAYWTAPGFATITDNQAIAPDGTNTAERIVDIADGTHQRYFAKLSAITAVAGATYTSSVYAKANGLRYISLYPQGAGASWTIYDLQTGTVSASGGANLVSNSITDVGSGWYKLSLTATATTSTAYTYSSYLLNQGANPALTYVGDGSGFYIWGAQLRETYGSSPDYIATTTPAINNISFTQITAGNQPVWFGDGVKFTVADTSTMTSTSINDDIFNNNAKTIYFVGDETDGEANPTIVAGTYVGLQRELANARSHWWNYDGAGGDGYDRIYGANNSWPSGATVVLDGTHDGTNINLSTNGIAATAVLSGNTALMTTTLRLGNTNSTFKYNGKIKALLTDDSVHTLDQRSRVRSCLAEKHMVRVADTCDAYIGSLNPTMWLKSDDVSTISKDGANKVNGWWSRYPYDGRENLLTYSEQFDHADWVKGIVATVVPNQIANPIDGALTADKLLDTANSATHLIRESITLPSAGTWELSVYAKAAERSVVAVSNGSAACECDLLTGAVTTFCASQNVGNGWYRCSIAYSKAAGASNFSIMQSINNYVGVGTGIYIWGAQLREFNGSPSDYIATTTPAINNVNFTQATAGKQPLWNGVGVNFDGDDDWMSSTATLDDVVNNNAKSWYLVAAVETLATDGFPRVLDANQTFGIVLLKAGTKIYTSNQDGGVDSILHTLSVPTTNFVYDGIHDGTNLNTSFNGTAAVAVLSGNTATMTNTLELGGWGTADQQLDGNIIALITYDSVHTADQRARVRSCLGQEHGVNF